MSNSGPVLDPGFSTTAMSACFSPDAHVRAMLDVQSALALACAEVGLEQQAVADEIAAACATTQIDAQQVLTDGWQVGTPVVALRALLREQLSPSAAAAIDAGHGSTTQDIVDTALQLQIRAGLMAIDDDLVPLIDRIEAIARAHRNTPMIGRTFLQHARATTFGLQAAFWLDPVADLAVDLRAARASCSIQLGGPVGTLEGLGEHGPQVGASLAERLDLRHPVSSWHTDRHRVVQVCALVGQLARAMAKIATDIALLSSTEIAEISVRSGGSSSMPGKQNPFDAVRAIAAADACAGAVATLSAARPIELQRGVGGWHLEWLAAPLVFMTGAAAVQAMRSCIESLQVHSAAMLTNLGAVEWHDASLLAAPLLDRIVDQHRTFDEH